MGELIVTEHEECKDLPDGYKQNCNYDISATGDKMWADSAKGASELLKDQKAFENEVNTVISGTISTCDKYSWKGVLGISDDWCDGNC